MIKLAGHARSGARVVVTVFERLQVFVPAESTVENSNGAERRDVASMPFTAANMAGAQLGALPQATARQLARGVDAESLEELGNLVVGEVRGAMPGLKV